MTEKNGTVTTYWKNGKVRHIESWKNGVEVGEFYSYYPSGKIRQKGEWTGKNGHWCECFTEDGILLYRMENGKEVFEHENIEELDTGAPYE